MFSRVMAIGFIFVCTVIAWMFLGSTISARTHSTDGLREHVVSTWGAPQEQGPPTASYLVPAPRIISEMIGDHRVERTVMEYVSPALPLESSQIAVDLNLEHRQKGLLWYSTYQVAFRGDYTFQNNTSQNRDVTFRLPLPASHAVYDDLRISIEGAPAEVETQKMSVAATALVPAGRFAHLRVSYRSQGLDTWRYRLGGEVAQLRNFRLTAATNFKDIDFPDNSLSPTRKREMPTGWQLEWNYQSLLSGFQIAIAMPEKLQPGPLAGEISYFAPVSLFFFFFVIFVITTLRDIDLHPVNYFFLAAAFFAFHLLLAYLVDHISIHTAFLICSAVSIFLVVSYLRLVVGMRFAALEAGTAQFLYLVLFSYAFFFKGFTGLTVTVGSILTLYVAMQSTGRIRWAERFRREPVAGSSRS